MGQADEGRIPSLMYALTQGNDQDCRIDESQRANRL